MSGQRQDIVSCGEEFDQVRKCVVAGFFSNAARLAPDGTYVTVRDSRRVVLDPMSVLSKFGEAPEWVVYHDVTLTTQEFMREVTAVNPKWLTEVAEHYYEYKKRSVAALPAPAASELAHLKSAPKKKEAASLDDDVIDALPVKITFKRKATPDVDVFGKKRDKRRGIGL